MTRQKSKLRAYALEIMRQRTHPDQPHPGMVTLACLWWSFVIYIWSVVFWRELLTWSAAPEQEQILPILAKQETALTLAVPALLLLYWLTLAVSHLYKARHPELFPEPYALTEQQRRARQQEQF